MIQGWKKVKQSAEYAGVSTRTFRPWLKEGLRHLRLPSGTILIKLDWIDQFLESFEHQENTLDNLADNILKGLK
jgi:hypothetical protein